MTGLIAEVLRAWREAERVALEHAVGTVEHERAVAAIEELRRVYQLLTDPESSGEAVRQALGALDSSGPGDPAVA